MPYPLGDPLAPARPPWDPSNALLRPIDHRIPYVENVQYMLGGEAFRREQERKTCFSCHQTYVGYYHVCPPKPLKLW